MATAKRRGDPNRTVASAKAVFSERNANRKAEIKKAKVAESQGKKMRRKGGRG